MPSRLGKKRKMKSFLKLIVLLLSFLCITSYAQTWHPMCANGSGNGGLHNSTWQKLNGAATGGNTWKQVGTCVTRVTANLVISSNTLNVVLNPSSVSGYVAGQTDVTLTVNSGVMVGSIQPAIVNPVYLPALTIDGSWDAGDTITIVNNGFIVGYGGNGGQAYFSSAAQAGGWRLTNGTSGANGGLAILFSHKATVYNNGVIGGGGGGGGGSGIVTPMNQPAANWGGGGAGFNPGSSFLGNGTATVTTAGANNGSGGSGGGLGQNGTAGGGVNTGAGPCQSQYSTCVGSYSGLPGGNAGACTSNFYGSGSVWNGNGCYGAVN